MEDTRVLSTQWLCPCWRRVVSVRCMQQCWSEPPTLQTPQYWNPHIRIINTQKLGSCVSTQGLSLYKRALLQLESKHLKQVYNWGKAMEIKRNWAWSVQWPSNQFFLPQFLHNLFKGSSPAPVTQWGSDDEAKRISQVGVVDQLRNFLIKCEQNKLIKVQTDSAGVKFGRNWG